MTDDRYGWALLGFALLCLQCGGSGDSGSTSATGQDTSPEKAISACGEVSENVVLDADLSTGNASCLVVTAGNVTIDGAGHRITAGQFAIQWTDESGVTVKNVVSDQALQMFGANASHNVVTDSTFGSLSIARGDDNTVQNSQLGSLSILGEANDPAQRETVSGNVISGTLTHTEQKLVEIITGTDGSLETDGTIHCAEGAHSIVGNQITGTVVSTDPTTEPELLHVRCGTGSVINENTIRTDQRAAGILLRDGADDNLVENNVVTIGDANEGALFIQSGSAGEHHPRNNTIQGNLFRATKGRSFWLQANATRGNAFQDNIFASDDATSEAVRLTDGTGVDTSFDHNTFYRGGSGTLIVFRDLGLGINRFSSNIFAYGGGPSSVFAFDSLKNLAGYSGDRNTFFGANAAVKFGSSGSTLCQWRSQTGQDLDSVEGDPAFTSPSTGDFHLASTSAARCTGENGSDAGALPSNDASTCPAIRPPTCP